MSFSNQCERCKHYWGAQHCDAFQEGIPDEIVKGLFVHDKAYLGDKGVRFEIDPIYKTEEDDQ